MSVSGRSSRIRRPPMMSAAARDSSDALGALAAALPLREREQPYLMAGVGVPDQQSAASDLDVVGVGAYRQHDGPLVGRGPGVRQQG